RPSATSLRLSSAASRGPLTYSSWWINGRRSSRTGGSSNTLMTCFNTSCTRQISPSLAFCLNKRRRRFYRALRW
ncbi:unnamed protein product, partial [Cylicocyclus nassatus]